MTPKMKQDLSSKLDNDVKLFVSRETELKIANLKIKGLEAEVKVLQHLVNMYAQQEIYKDI